MGRIWAKQIARKRAKKRKERKDKKRANRIVVRHFAYFAKKLKLLREKQ